MPDPPPRVYARQLLPFGYGYPLWTPEPGQQFLRYRRDGLRIGDVGVVVPENGSFDVFFNICLPRDHPFHRVNGVPDSFVHLDLDDLDVAIYPDAENSGSVISTSAVTAHRTVEPSHGVNAPQNALTYEFNLSSSEGALLILPDGAESYTLLKRALFRDVATRNGIEWYNFAERRLGRIISHDSLYLITGCYKSHSWSVAAFHDASSQTGATEFPAQFKAGQARQGSISASYTWESTRALHWRVGPQGGNQTAIPSQAVFISGFKIALRDSLLGKKRVEVEADAPQTRLKRGKLYDSVRGQSRAGQIWRRLVSKSGGERNGDQTEADAPDAPGIADDSQDVGGRVTVSHIPETLQSIHPSDAMNRYLLSKEPSAAVAVTHDSQWSILFERGVMKPEDLANDGRLESIVSESYRLVSQDGVVSLQATSDSSIRLTDTDNAVREAWEEDKLDEAEELLSRQIIRHKGSDHCAFGDRALIRARLHRWDAALRDAETSIDIQPSVKARVSKGFALFGQEKYASAVHTFNVALRECDVRDKVFVLLIKSIVLFEVGYRAESMAEIADLIEHCAVEVQPTCLIVQAEMYIRLAALAANDRKYDKALQLLSRAESLEPVHAIPELKVISLICGWRFDDLRFSLRRQKCQVLYATERVNEAVELLGELKRDLEDGARTKEDDARWIAAFTRQCLKSMESLGDKALTSQNYTDAIKSYSVALSMDPTVNEDILLKRSTAHGEMGAWSDALNDANEAIALNPLSTRGQERRLAVLQGMKPHDEPIQTFDSPFPSLARFAHDPQREIATIPRIGPSGAALHPYPPRHGLGHKLDIDSMMIAAQEVDFPYRAISSHSAWSSSNTSSVGSALQTDSLEQSLGASSVSDAPGTSFYVPATERHQDSLADVDRRHKEDYEQAPDLRKMVMQLAEQQLVPKPPRDEQNNIPVSELLNELRVSNTKQRELLDAFSSYWKKDITGIKEKQQEADGCTDREELPYVFRTLREDFISTLATEAQIIVEQVAGLGAERRQLQHELGQLMTMKSKYGPGGEFDPDWKPTVHPPPPTPRPAWRVPEKTSRTREPPRPTIPPLPARAESNGPGIAQNSRPGWRLVEPIVKQKLPTEHGKISLLGPPTSRKTSLLDVEPASEPDSISTVTPKTDMTARPTSPSGTIALHSPEWDELISKIPGLSPSSKPSLDRSSPKVDPSSAPSPLSFTFSPLDNSSSDVPRKLASYSAAG